MAKTRHQKLVEEKQEKKKKAREEALAAAAAKNNDQQNAQTGASSPPLFQTPKTPKSPFGNQFPAAASSSGLGELDLLSPVTPVQRKQAAYKNDSEFTYSLDALDFGSQYLEGLDQDFEDKEYIDSKYEAKQKKLKEKKERAEKEKREKEEQEQQNGKKKRKKKQKEEELFYEIPPYNELDEFTNSPITTTTTTTIDDNERTAATYDEDFAVEEYEEVLKDFEKQIEAEPRSFLLKRLPIDVKREILYFLPVYPYYFSLQLLNKYFKQAFRVALATPGFIHSFNLFQQKRSDELLEFLVHVHGPHLKHIVFPKKLNTSEAGVVDLLRCCPNLKTITFPYDFVPKPDHFQVDEAEAEEEEEDKTEKNDDADDLTAEDEEMRESEEPKKRFEDEEPETEQGSTSAATASSSSNAPVPQKQKSKQLWNHVDPASMIAIAGVLNQDKMEERDAEELKQRQKSIAHLFGDYHDDDDDDSSQQLETRAEYMNRLRVAHFNPKMNKMEHVTEIAMLKGNIESNLVEIEKLFPNLKTVHATTTSLTTQEAKQMPFKHAKLILHALMTDSPEGLLAALTKLGVSPTWEVKFQEGKRRHRTTVRMSLLDYFMKKINVPTKRLKFIKAALIGGVDILNFSADRWETLIRMNTKSNIAVIKMFCRYAEKRHGGYLMNPSTFEAIARSVQPKHFWLLKKMLQWGWTIEPKHQGSFFESAAAASNARAFQFLVQDAKCSAANIPKVAEWMMECTKRRFYIVIPEVLRCYPNLIHHKEEAETKETLLCHALQQNAPDIIIEYLLKKGCKVEDAQHASSGNSALHLAIIANKSDIARLMLREYNAEQFVNVLNEQGSTCLHEACSRGNLQFARELVLEWNADKNIRNKQDLFAYDLAAKNIEDRVFFDAKLIETLKPNSNYFKGREEVMKKKAKALKRTKQQEENEKKSKKQRIK